MKTMIETIKRTAEYIRSQVGEMPQTAVILGTGLGDLVNHIQITKEARLSHNPRFPRIYGRGALRQTDFRTSRGALYNGNARAFPLL